jgi:hypothetical protein
MNGFSYRSGDPTNRPWVTRDAPVYNDGMTHPLLNFFREWRYLILLAALIALLVIEPIAASFGIMESLFDAAFVLVTAALVLVLAQDKVWRFIAIILCGPAAILVLVGHLLTATSQDVSLSIGRSIDVLFFVLVTGKILHSIFTSHKLSMDSVFGAICGYLLLGVAWALTYGMLYTANPDSFHLSEAIRPQVEQGEYSRFVFIYYSFVTLTTVGYGDVTPLTIPARTLAWVEAVTGQLYLAVLIAGLISALVTRSAATNQRG